MYKYISIVIGICLVASSALGAGSLYKVNEPKNLGEFAVEERWYPVQIFEIREDLRDDRNKYSKYKSTINIWESDRISLPLTFKIKKFDIPKVRLTFKATF